FKEQVPELGYRYISPSTAISGHYGLVTRRAVTEFQRKYGLIPSGVVGADMRTMIIANCIPTQTLIQTVCPVPALTLELKRYNRDASTGYQVTALQKYLYGFKDRQMLGLSSVAESNFVGSGNFGVLTFRALSGFQATYGISVPTGILNEATRNAIISHCTLPPASSKVNCTNPTITKDISTAYHKNRDVYTEGQVSALQAFLYQYKDIFDWGISTYARNDVVTGYYGLRTRDLVRRFQSWFGVVSSTDPEYGKVLAATRAAITNQCDPLLSPVTGISLLSTGVEL
ncbi:MAG: peptidoglycan-binding protein, partial [Patescibacteria group bacterium]